MRMTQEGRDRSGAMSPSRRVGGQLPHWTGGEMKPRGRLWAVRRSLWNALVFSVNQEEGLAC